MVNKCTRFIQSLLWPATCVLCGDCGHDGRDLCRACARELPRVGHACRCCGRELAGTPSICGACLRQPPPFQRTVAALRYGPPVDKLIQRLKFHGRLQYAALLGGLLAEAVAAHCDSRPDCLLPVPLHPTRQRQRGFNQATELARPVSRQMGIPIDIDGCRRVRFTAPQSGLDRRARRGNLRGAFQVLTCPGNHVAIIDDVMTTGSTVRVLAQALRRSGVARVEVWCAARAEPQ